MQTNFTPEQLKKPGIQSANDILRSCVHCGFCTATCPTYQVLGDELDSPRGRIYLIKDMLENDRAADEKTVKHIDRCLSCLACMSTCPSGVHYMHLVDLAREHIEDTYKRPLMDRLLRWMLARILPYPNRFRVAILGAWIAGPFKGLLPKQFGALIDFAPKSLPPVSRNDDAQVFPAIGVRKKRIALMTGCAQKALNTDINDATIRILRRHGCEVVVAKGAGCCGALTHHMGKTSESHKTAAKNINAWMAEIDGLGLDAVVINTSGCGTTVKDYGHMFEGTELADKAKTISGLAKDISEVLADLDLPSGGAEHMRVAYHAACSLQHGQQIKVLPKELLRHVGYEVVEPTDAHLCCGSAGTYNLLQPEIAGQLQARKVATLTATKPDVIAAGNIGCMIQIGSGSDTKVIHTVELLDWATGGPKPPALFPGLKQ
jgi:glycolate oxidase iron-sulfur subunit